jgi:ATP-dependent protease ClpP protease subunit
MHAEVMRQTEAATHVFIGELGHEGQTAAQVLAQIGDAENIQIHVDSSGGDLCEALTLYKALKRRNTVATVGARACSAAVVVLCAARQIVLRPDSRLMLHAPRQRAFATAEELLEIAAGLKKSTEQIVSIVAERADVPLWNVRSILAGDDYWMSAEEALKFGLADAIEPCTPFTIPLPSGVQAAVSSDAEELFFEMLRAFEPLTVADRKAFLRNLSVWTAYQVKDSPASECVLVGVPGAGPPR